MQNVEHRLLNRIELDRMTNVDVTNVTINVRVRYWFRLC